MSLVNNTELEKYPKYFPRVYVYETAGPGALAWLRSCWERVFFGPKQYELEDLGERGLAFRCTLEPRLFGPTTQQEEKALATFKQAWEKLKDGWAKVLGNLSAQERENAPRYFDFLQLKTILPIYAPDGRYIEAWQALYELSLPLAPAQDSLPRPPRVLLEGEYLSLELRGNYLAKAVFAHLPVQARRGSDLFAERFTQPTAMLFKRVNGRFLAPFFMGENGASPACKEAVGVGEMELHGQSAIEIPIELHDLRFENVEGYAPFKWYFRDGKGTVYDKKVGDLHFYQFFKETVDALNEIIKYSGEVSRFRIRLRQQAITFDPPTIYEVFKDLTSASFLAKIGKGVESPVKIVQSKVSRHVTGNIEFASNLTIWDVAEYYKNKNMPQNSPYVPPFIILYHEIGHFHLYVKYSENLLIYKIQNSNDEVFFIKKENGKSVIEPKKNKEDATYYGERVEHDIVMAHYEVPLSKVAKVDVKGESIPLTPRTHYSSQTVSAIEGLSAFLERFVYVMPVFFNNNEIDAPKIELGKLQETRKKFRLEVMFQSKKSTTWEPEDYIPFTPEKDSGLLLNQVKLLETIENIFIERVKGELLIFKEIKGDFCDYEIRSLNKQIKQYGQYLLKNGHEIRETINATNKKR